MQVVRFKVRNVQPSWIEIGCQLIRVNTLINNLHFILVIFLGVSPSEVVGIWNVNHNHTGWGKQ